jgi:hypothetical protein
MGGASRGAERLEHHVQMLLGIVSAKRGVPLEFKPAYSVGDLLTRHLDEFEQEADRKGGVLHTLGDHFPIAKGVSYPRSWRFWLVAVVTAHT